MESAADSSSTGGIGRAEARVLEKAILLTRVLAERRGVSIDGGREAKHPGAVNGGSAALPSEARRAARRRMLLAGVLRIAANVGVLGPLVLSSDRVIDAAVLLARFTPSQALQLVRAASSAGEIGVDGERDVLRAVREAVRRWTLRRVLTAWRCACAATRSVHAVLAAPIHPEREHFLSERLRVFRVRAEMRRVLACIALWRSVLSHRRHSVGMSVHGGVGRFRNAQSPPFYDTRIDNGPLSFLASAFTSNEDGAIGNRAFDESFEGHSAGVLLKHRFFRQWRGLGRLRRGRLARGGAVATLYDGIRVARPSLRTWLARLSVVQFAGERADSIRRRALLGRVFDSWRAYVAARARGRDALQRWRAAASFRASCTAHAGLFARRKLAVRVLAYASGLVRRTCALDAAARVIADRRESRRLRWALAVWTGMQRWVARNSEKVRTLRAARDAAACLSAWRVWRETRAASDGIARASLLGKFFSTWRGASTRRHCIRETALYALRGWRRVAAERPAIRRFFGQDDVQIVDASYACALFRSAWTLRTWRRALVLARTADTLAFEHERSRIREIVRGWRAIAAGSRHAREAPRRVRARVLRAWLMRRVGPRAVERAALLEVLVARRNRMSCAASLSRWRDALAFSSARSHRLEDAAVVFQCATSASRCALFLRTWKTETARRMLARYTALQRLRRCLLHWRAALRLPSARSAAFSKSRALHAWRGALRASIARDFVRVHARRTTRTALRSWRLAASSARRTHAASTEFIGTNAARYCLARWRTEAALRRSPRDATPADLVRPGDMSFVRPHGVSGGGRAVARPGSGVAYGHGHIYGGDYGHVYGVAQQGSATGAQSAAENAPSVKVASYDEPPRHAGERSIGAVLLDVLARRQPLVDRDRHAVA